MTAELTGNKNGTPQTLLEAIQNGLTIGSGRPDDRVFEHVKDFLAQKFSAALLKTEDTEEQNRLWALWAQITNNEGERS